MFKELPPETSSVNIQLQSTTFAVIKLPNVPSSKTSSIARAVKLSEVPEFAIIIGLYEVGTGPIGNVLLVLLTVFNNNPPVEADCPAEVQVQTNLEVF
jgi:hypothetical protein